MKRKPITVLQPTNRQLKFLSNLNDALSPIAGCKPVQVTGTTPSYKFAGATPNAFINPVCFETSDKFKTLIEDLSQVIFDKHMDDVILFNNEGNMFRFFAS